MEIEKCPQKTPRVVLNQLSPQNENVFPIHRMQRTGAECLITRQYFDKEKAIGYGMEAIVIIGS